MKLTSALNSKPNVNKSVLVEFVNAMGKTDHTIAKYKKLKICPNSDREISAWFDNCDSGRKLKNVTHWCYIESSKTI